MRHVALLYDRSEPRPKLRIGYLDGSDPWLLRPFDMSDPRMVEALPDGKLLVLASDGQMVLLDPSERRIVLRGKTRPLDESVRIQLSRDNRRLFLYGEFDLRIINVDALTVAADFDTMEFQPKVGDYRLIPTGMSAAVENGSPRRRLRLFPKAGLVERADGKIVLSYWDKLAAPEPFNVFYGALIVDFGARRAKLHLVESNHTEMLQNPLRWFSPSGRYGIRLHCASVPTHSGGHDKSSNPLKRFFAKGRAAVLPDCLPDGKFRVGIAVELWQLDPVKPLGKHVVRMLPLMRSVAFGMPEDKVLLLVQSHDFNRTAPGSPYPFNENFDSRIFNQLFCMPLNSRLIDIVWTKDEHGYWVLLHHLWHIGMNEEERRREETDAQSIELRHVDLAGSLSPIYQIGRWSNSHTSADLFSRHAADRAKHLTLLDGNNVLIEAMESICLTLPSDTDGWIDTQKLEADSLVYGKFISGRTLLSSTSNVCFVVEIPSLSDANISATILRVTEKIRSDLRSMIDPESGYLIKCQFVSVNKWYDESSFFALIADQFPNAVGPLADMILAYISSAPSIQPRYVGYLGHDDEVPAFGHALLALARMDQKALHVIEAYMELKEVHRSTFLVNTVLSTYFRAHGWPSVDHIRFAIAHYLAGHVNFGMLWRKCGMASGIKNLMTPKKLAEQVWEVVGNRYTRTRDGDLSLLWSILSDIRSYLDAQIPFDAEISAALLKDIDAIGSLRSKKDVEFVMAFATREVAQDGMTFFEIWQELGLCEKISSVMTADEFAMVLGKELRISAGLQVSSGEGFRERLLPEFEKLKKLVVFCLRKDNPFDSAVAEKLKTVGHF
jgi:hypothetical protein